MKIEWAIPSIEESGPLDENAPAFDRLKYFFDRGTHSVTLGRDTGFELVYRKVEE